MGGAGQRRQLIGFPAVLVLIFVLGIATVTYAYIQRDAEARPGLSDHWHSAYGVWDCTAEGGGAFQPHFEGRRNSQGYAYDPDGIHSHSDGIIHIHPYTANVTGEDATIDKFFEAMFVTMDVNGITAQEFGVISAADAVCDDQPAVIQIVRWSDALSAVASEPDERIYDNFGDVRFKKDGEAFTLALAPRDSVVPLPPTISDLTGVSPSLVADFRQPEGPVPIEVDVDEDSPGVRVEEDG